MASLGPNLVGPGDQRGTPPHHGAGEAQEGLHHGVVEDVHGDQEGHEDQDGHGVQEGHVVQKGHGVQKDHEAPDDLGVHVLKDSAKS